MTRLRVIVVGALPPPVNGQTRVTEIVLGPQLACDFDLVHVDTSDHRGIDSVGRFDLLNVLLAVRHAVAFVSALRRRPALAYLPIAQTRLGFLRDALFLVAARAAGVPRLVHFNGQGFAHFYSAERGLIRWLARVALAGQAAAIVVGNAMADEFADVLPPNRVHVLPNGIGDLGDRGAERPQTVLFLSHLGSRKGVFDFLQAAALVRDRLPDTRFVLAGDWYRDEERRQADVFLVEHALQVEHFGPVAEQQKPGIFGDAALLAFPSPEEGHPLVVLEALATGTPVVATAVGAVPETVTDGVEGFLVQHGDVAALVDRICRLLEDEELRRRMGRAARARFERDFTDAVFTERLGQLWRSIVAQDASAPGPAHQRLVEGGDA